jgi:pimeloyl-ACP methyl ester carboxylesterase
MIVYKTFIGQTGCDIALPSKINKKKLIIICPGLPSDPSNYDLLDFLSNEGFLCVYVRYSGTWGSYGNFLKESPVKDIENIINVLSKNKFFIDSSNNQKVKLNFREIILLGTSFGGSVCLVSGAKSKNVDKIIVLSPIIDYRDHARNPDYNEEKLESLGIYLKQAYGTSYNFNSVNWKNFINGKLDINPNDYLNELSKKEIILLSGAKDKSISINRVNNFFNNLSSKKKRHYIFENSGHLSIRGLDKSVLKKVLN